jgi:Tol biopolymer transport system component
MRLTRWCAAVVMLMISTGWGEPAGGATAGLADDPRGAGSSLAAPTVFAPGVLSTDANELNCALAPDGSMVVFSEWRDGRNTLMVIHQEDGGWSARKVLPFSGSASDVDPFFSADGTRLYFSSKRPRDADDRTGDSDIWWVERNAAGEWGEPAPVEGVNSPDMDEYYTSISSRGSLYLSVFPEHGSPGDIYRAEPVEGGYAPPQRIGGGVSTEHSEHDPFIAPDESYLIFTSDRPLGFGRGDLWVVFRNDDGSWSEAVNMGPQINTEAYEYCAMLSPDGRQLFFTRNAGGNGDIYHVDAAVIEELRAEVP